jgi:hypothetical protein
MLSNLSPLGALALAVAGVAFCVLVVTAISAVLRAMRGSTSEDASQGRDSVPQPQHIDQLKRSQPEIDSKRVSAEPKDKSPVLQLGGGSSSIVKGLQESSNKEGEQIQDDKDVLNFLSNVSQEESSDKRGTPERHELTKKETHSDGVQVRDTSSRKPRPNKQRRRTRKVYESRRLSADLLSFPSQEQNHCELKLPKQQSEHSARRNSQQSLSQSHLNQLDQHASVLQSKATSLNSLACTNPQPSNSFNIPSKTVGNSNAYQPVQKEDDSWKESWIEFDGVISYQPKSKKFDFYLEKTLFGLDLNDKEYRHFLSRVFEVFWKAGEEKAYRMLKKLQQESDQATRRFIAESWFEKSKQRFVSSRQSAFARRLSELCLKEKLQPAGVPADGDCFFHALAVGMNLSSDQASQSLDPLVIRSDLVEYLKQEKAQPKTTAYLEQDERLEEDIHVMGKTAKGDSNQRRWGGLEHLKVFAAYHPEIKFTVHAPDDYIPPKGTLTLNKNASSEIILCCDGSHWDLLLPEM